jgi:hypothetical protein
MPAVAVVVRKAAQPVVRLAPAAVVAAAATLETGRMQRQTPAGAAVGARQGRLVDQVVMAGTAVPASSLSAIEPTARMGYQLHRPVEQ